jgi:putative dehydrogenase
MITVGIIGLGAMGAACARHLVAGGHQVVGLDLDAGARERLVAAGGEAVTSAEELAARCSHLVVFVVNAAQVEAVVSAIEPHLRPDAVVIQCATVPPAFIKELEARLARAGHLLLDAPVSGGTAGAGSGRLTIMASGAPEAFARARPVLDAMAHKVFDFGPAAGAGSMVKTINQLFAGVHLAALGEALALGHKAGLDPARLLEVYGGSAAGSWMMNDRGPRALQEGPPVTSAIDIFVKDLGLVAEAAMAHGLTLDVAAAAHRRFAAASAEGKGRQDDSQLWRSIAAAWREDGAGS